MEVELEILAFLNVALARLDLFSQIAFSIKSKLLEAFIILSRATRRRRTSLHNENQALKVKLIYFHSPRTHLRRLK